MSRSEKCAILEHVSDWHCANFVISKPHVKCKVLEHKKLAQKDHKKAKLLCLFFCLFFSVMNEELL